MPNTEYSWEDKNTNLTEHLTVYDHIDVMITGYDPERKRLLCSRRERLAKPWSVIVENAIKPIQLTGFLSGVHLNAIEISVDNLGKLMIPFDRLPGYYEGAEKLLIPSENEIQLVVHRINSVIDVSVKTELFTQKVLAESLCHKKQTILFVGATGVGKSSLINAILNLGDSGETADIGNFDPVTRNIDRYQFHGWSLWDTPGVGESLDVDDQHKKEIKQWLISHKLDDPTIVICVDANSRDYGSTISLLNDIKEYATRFLIVVNQVDALFPCNVYEKISNNSLELDVHMVAKIDQKIISTQERLKNVLDIPIKGIGVSAGAKNQLYEVVPYNIFELLKMLKH